MAVRLCHQTLRTALFAEKRTKPTFLHQQRTYCYWYIIISNVSKYACMMQNMFSEKIILPGWFPLSLDIVDSELPNIIIRYEHIGQWKTRTAATTRTVVTTRTTATTRTTGLQNYRTTRTTTGPPELQNYSRTTRSTRTTELQYHQKYQNYRTTDLQNYRPLQDH